MNLLGIDASSQNISLSVMLEGKIKVDFNQRIDFGASELTVYIDKALKKLSLKISDFDAFVLGSGPGSFTGLRISFAVIKAFALTTRKPIIALDSLLSCAYPLREKYEKIAVICDARKNLIYFSSFTFKKGNFKKKSKVSLLSLKQLAKKKDHIFITYDSHLRKELQAAYPRIEVYSKDIYPKIKNLMHLAGDYYQRKKFTPLKRLEPLYIHPKTCQIRKKK
tara:strand:- start:371 stop:1036 length:666 start_codon:yes stop_codon:yes gene_type:complete